MNKSTLAILALIASIALPAWLSARAPDMALANVALVSAGTRVTADSQYSDKHAGANAADGQVGPHGVGWFSRDQTKLPCALTFELPGVEDVRRVVLHQAQWTGNMYHTRDFAIETSADGRSWSPAAKGTMADDSAASSVIDLQANTKWLRVVVLTSYNDFQTCGLAEVEIMARRTVSVEPPVLLLDGKVARPVVPAAGLGFALSRTGSQALLDGGDRSLLACVRTGESVVIRMNAAADADQLVLSADCTLESGTGAAVEVSSGDTPLAVQALSASRNGALARLRVPASASAGPISLRVRGAAGESAVRIAGLSVSVGDKACVVTWDLRPTQAGSGPISPSPPMRHALQTALVEADWRMQDGIGTLREPSTYPQAAAAAIERGDALVVRMGRVGKEAHIAELRETWRRLKRDYFAMRGATVADPRWAELYSSLHWVKREMLFLQPAAMRLAPIVFAKQVPGAFSHQLTQYYGRYARPGGGIYILDSPGAGMDARQIGAGSLPMGSYMHPEVTWDADRIVFSFCKVNEAPKNTIQGEHGRFYHLYSVRPDGSGMKQLTDGSYDDFSPRVLPSDDLVFISTRRGGWHRCGTPGCENYVLTTAGPYGQKPVPISWHETQEWDPAVLNDGRVVYTRWDYVDRAPVFYEHLWTTFPDGAQPQALFGNNTFNPVGIWEPRAVPGSRRVMATGAAHHAMTAGSIVLLDTGKGVDGPLPIKRLTPDAPFPESETVVPGAWHYPMPGTVPHSTPESRRWPGHCYRSPYPLSTDLFLASYSFDGLIGEPNGNAPGMFGIYLCDAYGNKELLHRDPAISSVWPMPLQKRRRPPVLTARRTPAGGEGTMLLQDVYASMPAVPRGSIKSLRVVQVLPKSTPGKDLPPVGVASGAPGKQVLGTVPVERDGSAYFRVPAGRELAFQALDDRGMAVQTMRSGTYVQRGEKATCIGCHEPRTTAPAAKRPVALARNPSKITPGPDGSKPLSYPILVQATLDKLCVPCHAGPKAAGGADLTGRLEGHYTASYNTLVKYVPFSDMNNNEALSKVDRFGARGSTLMIKLLAGHHGVKLEGDALARLATWMDASALFYGTFDPADQARQQAGLRIKGPMIE